MSTLKKTLFVVTCQHDKWKFEMMCRSISAFLEPCRIVIVHNESDKKYKEWLEWFNTNINETLLYKFSVVTYPSSHFWPKDIPQHLDYELELGGWVGQQMLKILGHSVIKTEEYLILDSKNFFFRPYNIDDTPSCNAHGNWTLRGVTEWTKLSCQRLGLTYPGYHLKLRPNVTPYIFKTHVAKRLVKYFGGNLSFYCWFAETALLPEISPAEFILYDLFELRLGQRSNDPDEPITYSTIWRHQLLQEKQTPKQIAHTIIKEYNDGLKPCPISGFHSGVEPLLTLKDVRDILKILDIDFIMPTNSLGPF